MYSSLIFKYNYGRWKIDRKVNKYFTGIIIKRPFRGVSFLTPSVTNDKMVKNYD